MMGRLKVFTIFLFCLSGPARAAVYSIGLDKNLYTSDFMIGNVVVSIIFPESNGAIDPNTETWDQARQSQAISKIMAGLDWWTHQNSKSKVTFTYVTQTIPTNYEPVTRPYYDEALWIPDVMGRLGYNGTRFSSTRNYVNALRDQYNADWGFVIFVVDSLVDANGKFADGYFAYSYLGGPFTVMTYDNDGYGIANMDVVTAHETGHIFNALDEYAGASSPNSYTTGYFPTINGNHVYATTANDPNSIMRGGIRWGLDGWAKEAIGWKDSNANGRDDIVDQTPIFTITQQSQASAGGDTAFSGTAKVKVLPRQSNSNGYGFTVDSIARVEYRPGNGSWLTADPSDGHFDSPEEAFQITIPANQSSLGAQTVITSSNLDVRIITTYATFIGISGPGPSTTGGLSEAHVYPNPYKPNSGLGHSGVTFTALTSGARVQVFSPAGEPVFEKNADSTGNAVTWPDVDDVDSGVYYFLITDTNGEKKKGKLAVIK